MKGLVLHSPVIAGGKKLPLLSLVEYPPPAAGVSRRIISAASYCLWLIVRCREKSRSNLVSSRVRVQASKVSIGSEGYGGWGEEDNGQPSDSLSDIEKQPNRLPHPFSMALVLFAFALVFSLEAFVRGGPASPLAIGDKTFFIAALLAMQYKKGLVLLGSIGALALMTILSVVIGRIFHSVPAQFQTNAWNLPSNVAQGVEKSSPKLDEYFQAEDLVKEKVSRRLSNPLEIVWKLFSLIFFAVLLGSVGALAVMTILSVVIGRIFHPVSTQFHTTLPIGKYAAVTLLVFFGLISIKDAWELLSNVAQGGDEYVGAEELVKEKLILACS